MSVETFLRVPIAEATQWGWLEERLGDAAEEMGVEYDGCEEEGPYEVHAFDGISAADLRELAAEVLGTKAEVKVTGDHEVTVEVPSAGWIKVLGPKEHHYDWMMRRLSKKLAADPELAAWWAESGFGELWILQSPATKRMPPGVEFEANPDGNDGVLLAGVSLPLNVLDEDRPAKGKREAQRTLGRTLLSAAEYLGRPLPPDFRDFVAGRTGPAPA